MSLEKEKVSKAVNALLTVAKKLEQNSLIDEVDVIQLQICVTKVPPKEKSIKLKLPHGLKHEKTDVCLFVKDLDGGKDREYEPTKTHFEELFSKQNINCVAEIIPLKSLKLEYKPYEAKRNLSNAYDVFLADARIIRLLPSFLGKHFYGRKKAPVQVNLEAKKLKEEIDTALNNSKCAISNKGSSSLAVIANVDMKESDVVENVMSSVSQIGDSIPGGWKNIKQLNLKTGKSPSIPIFMSSAAPQDVTIPREDRKSEPIEAEEISTVFGAKVKVYPNGVVKVIKDGEEDEDEVPKKRRKFSKKKKFQKVKPDKSKSKSSEENTPKKSSKSVTKKPETVTKKPETVTKKPETVTKKSDTVTKKSDTVTKKPDTVTKKPETVSKSSSKASAKSPAKSVKKAVVKTPVRASKRKLTA